MFLFSSQSLFFLFLYLSLFIWTQQSFIPASLLSNPTHSLSVGLFFSSNTSKVVFERTDGRFSHKLSYSKVRLTQSITTVMIGRWQECEFKYHDQSMCILKLDAMESVVLQLLSIVLIQIQTKELFAPALFQEYRSCLITVISRN